MVCSGPLAGIHEIPDKPSARGQRTVGEHYSWWLLPGDGACNSFLHNTGGDETSTSGSSSGRRRLTLGVVLRLGQIFSPRETGRPVARTQTAQTGQNHGKKHRFHVETSNDRETGIVGRATGTRRLANKLKTFGWVTILIDGLV